MILSSSGSNCSIRFTLCADVTPQRLVPKAAPLAAADASMCLRVRRKVMMILPCYRRHYSGERVAVCGVSPAGIAVRLGRGRAGGPCARRSSRAPRTPVPLTDQLVRGVLDVIDLLGEWSEWQDLDLRPPPPARGLPLAHLCIFTHFCSVPRRCFAVR